MAEGSDRYIRVLTLEPANTIDESIHGCLESLPLDTSYEQYEALSYTWGSNINSYDLHRRRCTWYHSELTLGAATTANRTTTEAMG